MGLETEKILPPQNDGFQKELPFWGTSFQVPFEISGVYIHSTSKKDSSSKQRMYVSGGIEVEK